MHTDKLKVFIDIIENKSFSKAAQLNSLTQSAVSQQLTTMEKEYNVAILDHSQKRFCLTPQGEIFYKAAKDIIHRIDQMVSDMQASKKIVSGSRTISSVYSVGLYELQAYVGEFLKTFPSVNLRIDYYPSSRVYDDVLHNIADLGVVAFPQQSRLFEIIPFKEDRFVVVCAPDNPLSKRNTLKLEELASHRLIGLSRGNPVRKAVDRFFEEAKVDPDVIMEPDNIEILKRAVEINAGAALVPASTVVQEVEVGLLASIEIEGKPLLRPTGIIYRKGRVLTVAMKKFIEMLTKPSGK